MARDYKKEYKQDLKTGKSGPDSAQRLAGQFMQLFGVAASLALFHAR